MCADAQGMPQFSTVGSNESGQGEKSSSQNGGIPVYMGILFQDVCADYVRTFLMVWRAYILQHLYLLALKIVVTDNLTKTNTGMELNSVDENMKHRMLRSTLEE